MTTNFVHEIDANNLSTINNMRKVRYEKCNAQRKVKEKLFPLYLHCKHFSIRHIQP